MRKRAFTLAQILIVIAVIAVIAVLTIIPLNKTVNEAAIRTAWKNDFALFNQAFDRILIAKNGTAKNMCINEGCFKNAFTNYLSTVKECEPGVSDNCWHKDNEWHWMKGDDIAWGYRATAILSNNSLASFHWYSPDCSYTDEDVNPAICGCIYVDVNGFNKPNIVGKDIFGFWVSEKKLTPFGASDYYYPATDCTPSGYGIGCSVVVLKQ